MNDESSEFSNVINSICETQNNNISNEIQRIPNEEDKEDDRHEENEDTTETDDCLIKERNSVRIRRHRTKGRVKDQLIIEMNKEREDISNETIETEYTDDEIDDDLLYLTDSLSKKNVECLCELLKSVHPVMNVIQARSYSKKIVTCLNNYGSHLNNWRVSLDMFKPIRISRLFNDVIKPFMSNMKYDNNDYFRMIESINRIHSIVNKYNENNDITNEIKVKKRLGFDLRIIQVGVKCGFNNYHLFLNDPVIAYYVVNTNNTNETSLKYIEREVKRVIHSY